MQFTPVDGGYLYYPSKRSGGKLVSAEEYAHLTSEWGKIAGRRGSWITVGMVMLAIVVWTTISQIWSVPGWSRYVFVTLCVAAMSARIIHASFATRRLVKDRPAITPPRPPVEVGRQARALLNWRSILFGLLFNGVIFFASLTTPDRDIASWAWLVGSGVTLGLCLWIAFRKLRDRSGATSATPSAPR